MAVKTATQQDTESLIFGSGADTYEWWHRMRRRFVYDSDYKAPNGWAWVVQFEDPKVERTDEAEVTHSDVMRAVRKIAQGEVEYASDALRKECRNMIFDVDKADLDAGDADCILQVATMGGIFFG